MRACGCVQAVPVRPGPSWSCPCGSGAVRFCRDAPCCSAIGRAAAPRGLGIGRPDASAACFAAGCARSLGFRGDQPTGRISIAPGSRNATGKRSTPSLTTARATAGASIWSDFPSWPFPSTGDAHHPRRDTHDLLAGAQQSLLQSPGDMPAVLDRPHTLLIQLASPTQRLEMTQLIRLIWRSPTISPVPFRTAASACACVYPLRSRSSTTVHSSRLSLKRTSGGQTSVGATPRSYQVTPAILGSRGDPARLQGVRLASDMGQRLVVSGASGKLPDRWFAKRRHSVCRA